MLWSVSCNEGRQRCVISCANAQFSCSAPGFRIGNDKGRYRQFRARQRALWLGGLACDRNSEAIINRVLHKSGLYTEFRDKEDLFLACLRRYLESQDKRGLLTKEPLGWKNIETFLKNGPLRKGEQQGCFAINSMREFAILPEEAYGPITENRVLLLQLLALNIEAEKPTMAPSAIAEMVLSFFSGLCIERNLKSGKASSARKVGNFMTALRSL